MGLRAFTFLFFDWEKGHYPKLIAKQFDHFFNIQFKIIEKIEKKKINISD